PFAVLTWYDLDKLSTAILCDFLDSALQVPGCDVLYYRKQGEQWDEQLNAFRKKVVFCESPGPTFTERVQSAVEQTRAAHYHRIIVILEPHVAISPDFLGRIFGQLTFEDDCLVVGPTLDGRCFLIGMKSNHSDLFTSGEGDP